MNIYQLYQDLLYYMQGIDCGIFQNWGINTDSYIKDYEEILQELSLFGYAVSITKHGIGLYKLTNFA